MTKYTVAIKGEGEATAKDTSDLDDALDWFTNACTEVLDPAADLAYAALTVDGVIWGMIQEGGIAPPGEVRSLRAA